ncbi:unnamed protein product [Rhizoctonia solani]|uniref:DRBM domain-containing protein n=1 Tax=Rhizoctonia solani TaxID=456999 RepID=A0A8H3DVF2_9AGAM|nr:unnamed protein product [Rhizoctonia solani]
MSYSVDPNDFVMKLNGLLQAQGRLSALTWEEAAAGPADRPEWTITAFVGKLFDNAACTSNRHPVNNQVYGYGTHRTKRGAQYAAARMTLQNLAILEFADN